MRFVSLSAAAAAGILCVGSLASAAPYLGNGGTGFGGPIGGSTLTVTDDGTNVNFSLATGTAFSGNALVIYIDSKTGGYGDTSTFTDVADGGRTAISGDNTGNPSRSLVTFSTGFTADFALAVEPGVFAGLFDLSTPSNFGFVANAGLVGSGTGPFTFSVSRASLGLPTTGDETFSFVGSLISTSAYRSNETIGTSVTVPGTLGDTPNAGFAGSTTFAAADTFTTVVGTPEPASLSLLGLAALGGLRRRRA